jgi:predicted nucleic acid-binding protein
MAHHRSGSNFLNDLLQSHPRIECINEPLSMHTKYFRDCDLEPWTRDEFDPTFLHPSLAPHGGLRSFLLDFRGYLSQSNDLRVIGFKDTVLFGKLEWLKEFLPSLKILFLKRDSRSVISSVLRSNLLGFWKYDHLVPPAFRKLYPNYVSKVHAGDWSTLAAEIVAMSVVTRHELARRTVRFFEHREFSLDELTREPERRLQDIAEFLGVDAHEAQLSFLQQRQAETRGGRFSSFRSRDDVERSWERHLSAAQIGVIEDVLQCA